MTTATDYRPQFSVQYLRLKTWYTPERFQYIWDAARMEYCARGSESPAREFVWDIGVSRRSVSRWLNGARPSRMAMMRLERTLRSVWGDDWMHVVEHDMEDTDDDARDRRAS